METHDNAFREERGEKRDKGGESATTIHEATSAPKDRSAGLTLNIKSVLRTPARINEKKHHIAARVVSCQPICEPNEPKIETSRSFFRFLRRKCPMVPAFFLNEKNETEINTGRSVSRRTQPNSQHFKGFGVRVLVSCDFMIVWCQVAFLPYLGLLRQTVQVDTLTYNLQQAVAMYK